MKGGAALRKLLGLPTPGGDDHGDHLPEAAPPPGRRRRTRPVHWWTPWTWVSAAGIYVGDDGAWCYRNLPVSLLSDGGLTTLLTDPAAAAGDGLHLLLHAWSAPIEEAALRTTGTGLDDYLAETVHLYAPVRRLIIGVKLRPGGAGTTSTLASVYDTIDAALGEAVPDLACYDDAVAAVDAWLGRYHGAGLDREATDMLESWYTLGHQTNVTADEGDSHIRLSDGHLLTFATANPDPTSDRHPPAPPPPPTSRSAVVTSARATCSDGQLSDLSVVYGRRSLGALPWTDTLRAVMPAANPGGLPLRQLPALDETLPSSASRLNPAPTTSGPALLAAAGFVNPAPVGDPAGLFCGMGGIGYADPIRYNPLTGGLHLYGGESAGKTFIAEHLAVQAMLAGMTVRYLSGDGDAGRALVDAGAATVTAAAAGMFDPGRLPGDFSAFRRAVLAGIASATPQVDPSVFERASVRGLAEHPGVLPAFAETAELIYSPRDAALLRRAAATPNTLAWAALRKPDTALPAGSAAWSVPHILNGFIEDFGTREAAAELLAAAALLTPAPAGSAGLLVILDGLNTGALVDLAAAAASHAGHPLGVITCARTLPGALTGFCLLGAGLDPQTIAGIAGTSLLDVNLAGRRSYADIDTAHVINSAATWTVRDRHGRVAPLVAAPVGARFLGSLTRIPGAIYS